MRAFPWRLLAVAVLATATSAQAQIREQAPGWATFVIPEYGTRVEYPAGIFVPTGDPEKGTGRRFDTSDGRARLSVYARDNDAGDTPAAYVGKNLRVQRNALDYQRIAPSFFAISMERDGLIYYSRCNFSRGGGRAIHCFDLIYPQAEKRAWDAVVTRISLSLRPLEG
jgi:hypothetical protein